MKIRYKFFIVFVVITLFSLFINYFISSLGVQKIVYKQTEQTLDSGLNTNYLILKNFLEQFQNETQRLEILNSLSSVQLEQEMALLLKNQSFDWIMLQEQNQADRVKTSYTQIQAHQIPSLEPGEVFLLAAGTDFFIFTRRVLDSKREWVVGKLLNPVLNSLYHENGQAVLLYLNTHQLYSSDPDLIKSLQKIDFEVSINRLISNLVSSGLFILKGQNQEFKANYRSIDFRNGQLKILLLQPTDFEKQIILEMVVNLAVFSVFFLLILLIFSYYISKNIISPFQSLMDAILKRNKENITDLLERKDEVGDIAIQFWQIMDDLYSQQAQKEKVHSLIAHDLKTPLIAISRTLENIRDQDHISREQRITLINMMLKHCNNSLNLITNLLNVQKYELGKINLFLAKDDLNGLLSESVEGLRPLAEAKQIEIALALDKNPAPLMFDRMEISRVLKNLVANAIKYTQNNGVISIHSKFSSEGVEVVIRDNGQGIPEELQTTIFDFYNRNNRLIKDNAQADLSTGLGLYLCRQIIEAHRGWLRLVSEEGKGSQFTFFLPHRYSRNLEVGPQDLARLH
ncbi:hypothetical protein COW36_23825 [bacterium (Candidatus Blackallbacteria) CG17_big_fil_post_rev_8_21_14_2_50_48_46]|uniref:histidine kinase n=1 Tax=bacterium (Candidatus Blackallbacteria) CG17_big_fil_post_rev_8_21_14_2_50_48_46 TaxID=2014261 RepID=A0A2M7FXH1_9BACT|nr:MAG: hypothetical protein COW64_18765 [bacterium (Candidatus Blackallbacteria) CG18_big_fil_WC_8_21_14_2_50_49_26]PIW13703.1 MAG: hypothetical protein COW36_23825 [bacterium (Candidatus Blackallbacteria) CG17_big_fil_post_rev_8_21_14_2_50_48_46]PIW44929.1 MAG: hypothetical protein COW20_21455 [bacterium (Candidatus Blackallbacteria) CG13_big_fil_rev_8_21_14_2_50_49_14]